MKTRTLIVSITLLLSILMLELLSLFYPNWSTIQNENFNLTSCQSCSKLLQNWSLECMTRKACYDNNDTLCENYSKDFYAGVIYIYIQIACIFTTLMLLEKFGIMAFNEDIGYSFIVYIVLFINWILQLLAIIMWWFYSIKDSEVKANTGPKIGIFLAVWTSLGSFYLFYVFYKEKYSEGIQCIQTSQKILGMSPKIWMILSISLILLGLCLIIASISTKTWLTYKNTYGGLIRCKDCNEIPYLSWECLAGTECENNKDSKTCKIYLRLAYASKCYLILSSISIILIIFFLQSGISTIISRKYGNEQFNLTYLILGIFLQLISTILWADISKVKVSSQCDDDICGSLGISLAISSNFFIFIGAILYSISIRYETYIFLVNIDLNLVEAQRLKSTCPTPRNDMQEKH
ncbi:hypothetical protein SteCoe_16375 [Stentor coeruleus]|uniref:Uncharacterized protein n=1 Tax=Stentor coeruleus TaxID=5963 RepID=A0A1R2C1D9_9CILI|nr:hypothetical protein SteCoe_16375 [Stentor coeruleus]